MYIGPWQEYRLAKIQDDAIQRIRQEWEDNIRAQLPDGDDGRIRELMQPLMAKLPALLMAKKSADSRDAATTRKARRPAGSQSRQSTRPSTAVSTVSSTPSREEAATSAMSRDEQSNQETHEADESGSAAAAPAARPRRAALSRQSSGKKKKKPGASGAHGNALDEVEKRKKMFAKWKKAQQDQPPPPVAEASSSSSASASSSLVEPSSHLSSSSETRRLPPIHPPDFHARPARDDLLASAEPTRLPLLVQSDADALDAFEPQAPSPREEPNLEDSLDEDEVNNLLNWTDNLLSPNTLESSFVGLDDDVG